MSIQVLKDSVVNKIAAGEVVERPASVVRELVDNALDAGADDIAIYLEGGGRSSIRIVDNGWGMSRDDALLSLERHATSKITSAEDLLSIASYGFRGEALSSIAAVSRITLRTKRADDASGMRIEMHGGTLKNVEETAMPQGTDISVRNLFFNTPARKKFLRTAVTERKRIKAWVQQAMLVHPGVRIRLEENGSELVNYPRRNDFVSRAKERFKGAYVPLDESLNGIQVSGLLGHPSLARADSASMTIFINRRMVRDRLIAKAVREGFLSTLKDREYPIGCLSIEMNPADLDVNVHPQKSEVRFQEPNTLYAAVRDSVAQAVKTFTAPVAGHIQRKKTDGYAHEQVSRQRQGPPREGQIQGSPSIATPLSQAVEAEKELVQQQELCQDRVIRKSFTEEIGKEHPRKEDPRETESSGLFSYTKLQYIGQALSCYLFFEKDDDVFVVDMHAAHERVTYNRLSKQIAGEPLDAQLLLVPITISVMEDERERLLEYQHTLARYGIDIESFGEDTLLVRSVPSILEKTDVGAMIRELAAMPLEEMAQDRIIEALNHRIARLACHASVRSGARLNEQEAYALVADMDTEEFAGACPHGRPAVVRFGKHEIEKWFGRDR